MFRILSMVVIFCFFLFFLVLVNLSSGKSLQYESDLSKECEWQMGKNEEWTLRCQIGSLNQIKELIGNLSYSEAEHLTSVSFECIIDGSIQAENLLGRNLFKTLSNLEKLEIIDCKCHGIQSMDTLMRLKKLSVISYTPLEEWSSEINLELSARSFDGLHDLKFLDLTGTNLWKISKEVFCPLGSLTHLNLSSNKLQDVQNLGFSDWGNGPLEPGKSCANTLEILDLSNNRIVTVEDNAFSGLRTLESLNLQENLINNLFDRSLVGLNSLNTLNLSSNSLMILPPELFQSSRQLMNLFLQNNSLNVLGPGLFEGLDQLRVLDLSTNQLTNTFINKNTFSGLVRLVVLNLGYNQLSKIDANLFHDLYSLQVLNLENNFLSIIYEGAFGELKNLHSLTLSHNKITRIESYYFTGIYALNQLLMDNNEIEFIHTKSFENVTNLQDLGLNGNMLDNIPNGISQLRLLKTLDLGKNRIESISNSSFEGLDLLYGLRLVDNQINNISKDTFATLPSLQVLNLASNKIKIIESNAFDSNPTLKAIRLDANLLTEINDIFSNLKNLMWLNISSNKLNWFDFAHLPSELEWLDLHSNEISTISNYNEKSDDSDNLKIKMLDASFNLITEIHGNSIPNSVETLYLQHNNIKSIAHNSFIKKTSLKKVVLYDNNIRYLDLSALSLTPVDDIKDLPEFYIGANPFFCDCKMEWLLRINDLTHLLQYPQVLDLHEVTCELAHARGKPPQPLLSLKPSNFLCPYQAHCFALCHCCDFDACDCKMTCPERCSCYHDHTWSSNVVDCSQADYNEIPEKIPMDATEIYLDGNDLGQLENHLFIGKKRLEVLYLNHSNIQSLSNRTFNGAGYLKILHIEGNELEKVQGDEFNNLDNIQELYLDNNGIKTLPNNTFTGLQHLRILTLNDNDMVNFVPDKIKLGQQIYLEGNKWSCECSYLRHVTSWIRSSRINTARMFCLESLSETVKDALNRCGDLDNAIATSVVQPQFNVTEFLGENHVSLVATILASIIILSLIVAVIFVFRNEMRLWAYTKYGVRLFYDKRNEGVGQIYDCYMIYGGNDEDLVARSIATELESVGYSVCLHYRDLQLLNGAAGLAEAMMRAADASKRIVLVISPELVYVEWARPEFRAALLTTLRTIYRQKLICIVSGKTLDPIDPELRTLLRTSTVIKWDDRRFWEKLRYALPDILNNIANKYKSSSSIRQPDIHIHNGNNFNTLNSSSNQRTYTFDLNNKRNNDDGNSNSYGSETLAQGYVSVDRRIPQNLQFCGNQRNNVESQHVYSTIPDALPQSQAYFL